MDTTREMEKRHLERIRLLSARFYSLQGLRVAAAGVSITTVVGGYVIAAPEPSNTGSMIAMAASMVLFLAAQPWFNRYYADNFGRQVFTPPRYLPLLLIPYWVAASYLNTQFPEIPPGGPTLGAVVLGSLAIAIRDWPWRAYYLGATAAVTGGFLASASVTGLFAPGMTLAAMFFLLGASLVPIGLLDHRLLVKLMNEARQPMAEATRSAAPPSD